MTVPAIREPAPAGCPSYAMSGDDPRSLAETRTWPLPRVVDDLLRHLNRAVAWAPTVPHRTRGGLRYRPAWKGEPSSLRIVPYRHGDPDCEVCGPEIRGQAGREIISFLSGAALHAGVLDPDRRDTIGKQIRDKTL